MDKNKIKNIALGVSLGLNILLGFFLGGGLITSCAAKKPVEASSSLSTASPGENIDCIQKVALKRPPLRLGIDFDQSDNLYQYQETAFARWTGNTFYLYRNADYTTAYAVLEPNKTYWIRSYPDLYFNMALVSLEYSFERAWDTLLIAGHAEWPSGTATNTRIQEGYYALSTTTPMQLICCSGNANNLLCVCVDTLKARPTAQYVLPTLFNPYTMWGDRTNDILVRGPATSDSARTDAVTFSSLYFNSNGMTFNYMQFFWRYKPGTNYGRLQPDVGALPLGVVQQSSSNTDYYLSGVVYGNSHTQYAVTAWTANFYAITSNVNLLIAGGIWANDGYRYIDLIDDSAASVSGVPTGQPANTAAQWLRVMSESAVVPSTGNADLTNAFDVLSQGFTAVGNILSIPILPFMTLGTLIAVPLIVLIILAILRLLAK